MEINYNLLIEKVKETRNSNYDCRILMFFAGEVMMEEEDSELRDQYFPLLLYFDTVACDDQVRFEDIINFLYNICTEREIDSFDLNYVLNKEEIDRLINKHKLGFITKDLLVDRLKKYFYTDNIPTLLKLFEKRLNIIISI